MPSAPGPALKIWKGSADNFAATQPLCIIAPGAMGSRLKASILHRLKTRMTENIAR
jgi:hypothetical protein